MVSLTTASTSAGFETSHSAPSQRKPRFFMASTVGLSHCSRRASTMREEPASASPSAISSPRPREPPVTRATWPVRSKSCLSGVIVLLSGCIDDQAGEALAMIRGVAEHQLGGLGPLVVQVHVILPGEAHAAVHLDAAIA